MPINVKDLSNYQRYLYGNIKPENLREINFPVMSAADPELKAVWIKSSEGIGVANYNPLDYENPARLADAAGLGVGPYHYWHDGLDVRLQAQTFWDSAKAFPGTLPPMVDIEDTEAFKDIDVPSTLSTKVANARWLFESVIWLYLTEVERLFGRKPLIYTGSWWWNRFTKLLLLPQSSTNPEPWPANKAAVDKYNSYMCYSACYDPRFANVPSSDYERGLHVVGPKEALWQYTSTPKPPIPGINVPGMNGVLGEAVDCGKWLLTDKEFYTWTGLPEPGVIPPPPPPSGEVTRAEFNDLRSWAMNNNYKGFTP